MLFWTEISRARNGFSTLAVTVPFFFSFFEAFFAKGPAQEKKGAATADKILSGGRGGTLKGEARIKLEAELRPALTLRV